MNDHKIFPKTLYVSIPRKELEALRAERDALKAEVKGLKAALADRGIAVDVPKVLRAV